MVTVDKSNRVRISSAALSGAGLTPGSEYSVIQRSRNSISIVPANTVSRSTRQINGRVEQDGRARFSRQNLKTIGVSSRRKNFVCEVNRNGINVTV